MVGYGIEIQRLEIGFVPDRTGQRIEPVYHGLLDDTGPRLQRLKILD